MNYSFDDFFYFYLVVKHGGFTTASEATKISKSKLSRHVADLEKNFKVQLIQRTTRSFKITAIGQALYEECRKIVNQIHSAENLLLSQTSPIEGIIHVALHPLLFHSKIQNILDQFSQQHPNVKIKLELTQAPTKLSDNQIHIGLAPDLEKYKHPHTSVIDLFQTQFCLVVVPDLVENIIIKHPYDLYQLPRIYTRNQHLTEAWTLKNGSSNISIDCNMEPYFFTEDFLHTYYSAHNGLGVANLPYSLVEKDLKSGQLMQILSQWNTGSSTVQLIHLTPNTKNRALEQLIKALVYGFNPMQTLKNYHEIM